MPTHYEKLDAGLHDVEGTLYIKVAVTDETFNVSKSTESAASLKSCCDAAQMHSN
ncbi:MAG TPA: hypothetical protein VKB46_28190 [Pyrinomonadaceae bacterium]|nr:hypothetical protein [Pyrinomonadaceae bacterium]